MKVSSADEMGSVGTGAAQVAVLSETVLLLHLPSLFQQASQQGLRGRVSKMTVSPTASCRRERTCSVCMSTRSTDNPSGGSASGCSG